jgi:hypothetical protein
MCAGLGRWIPFLSICNEVEDPFYGVEDPPIFMAGKRNPSEAKADFNSNMITQPCVQMEVYSYSGIKRK